MALMFLKIVFDVPLGYPNVEVIPLQIIEYFGVSGSPGSLRVAHLINVYRPFSSALLHLSQIPSKFTYPGRPRSPQLAV